MKYARPPFPVVLYEKFCRVGTYMESAIMVVSSIVSGLAWLSGTTGNVRVTLTRLQLAPVVFDGLYADVQRKVEEYETNHPSVHDDIASVKVERYQFRLWCL